MGIEYKIVPKFSKTNQKWKLLIKIKTHPKNHIFFQNLTKKKTFLTVF
jgi:hypothetical protein